MIEQSNFPPFLPERLQTQTDLWVGTTDPYSPQLIVIDGPNSEVLKKAYREKSNVLIRLESRTCDMDEDELNDYLGVSQVRIMELFGSSTDCFNFLATGELPYGGNLIWVWDYTRHRGVADFSVDD